MPSVDHAADATKIHALTDGLWRPVAFMLTAGQVADCKAVEVLLEQMPETGLVNADKGYDSNAICRQISERGPSPTSRQRQIASGRTASRPFYTATENAIERMFCRLKDSRRIATRYDRLATNFLAAVCIAATVSFWL
ncbi:transposase [Mesorhizobium sp. M0909]|uniref:transposase n=1 Tax=Mesorhizobium sp. M0909 TaxID=2957024 RepID=UPI00333C9F8E